jgi:hypothetical protein
MLIQFDELDEKHSLKQFRHGKCCPSCSRRCAIPLASLTDRYFWQLLEYLSRKMLITQLFPPYLKLRFSAQHSHLSQAEYFMSAVINC